MGECCANCKYNKYVKFTDDFICDNEDSEGYGLSTSYDDYCGEFEEKEE